MQQKTTVKLSSLNSTTDSHHDLPVLNNPLQRRWLAVLAQGRWARLCFPHVSLSAS
ncbi:hypothetical protein VITFI_CDS3279 (plasmid) [Vitreoscilla filiformis]|uniref:Uncharacterized protein n=1 Tax=Vitreoscilla filiformis TaxID=63 RepID=A0A221KJ61_VITFI|nr:hypothetical protein VITFI_CDS3279 [Vitreoscilla filiformis]